LLGVQQEVASFFGEQQELDSTALVFKTVFSNTGIFKIFSIFLTFIVYKEDGAFLK
jgi:hypothetical protein